MSFVIILLVAIGILYWFKKKGEARDRQIEMEKQRQIQARKKKDREKRLDDLADRMEEFLDKQDEL